MALHRSTLVLAAGAALVFSLLAFWARRIEPALKTISATTHGAFTAGGGWYAGEPLVTTKPVRAWGSWSGADENTGRLEIGPFPAPAQLRFAVSGYPSRTELYLERLSSHERIPVGSGDIGERWGIVDVAIPSAWRDEPILIVANDNATGHAGWIALTEPIVGGSGDRRVMLWQGLAWFVPLALLVFGRSRRRDDGPPAALSDATRYLPWAAAVVAILPLLHGLHSFMDIWWFGDEWDQLDHISRVGFWRWTIAPFGENVVPIFKTVWGSVALAARGSYFPLLAAVWLNHAINTGLLARLLRQAGFGWTGTAIASATFGLTVAHAEILCWSIQWSNVLATTFLLLAMKSFFQYPPQPSTWNLRRHGAVGLYAAMAALTFVRGVLTGAVLAFVTLFLVTASVRDIGARWRAAVLYMAPTLLVVGWIFLSATGNHQALGKPGVLAQAAEFALWFWAAVPFHRLLELADWNGPTTALLGSAKFILIVAALNRSNGIQRQLLAIFALFDVGNSLLLGFGRYQTGLPLANSSRYYYSSLVCVLPFVAWHLDDWLAAVRLPVVRNAIAAAVAIFIGWRVARGWPAEAELFAQHRGRATRQILLRDANPPPVGAVPGIPFLSTTRAKELIALYHLH